MSGADVVAVGMLTGWGAGVSAVPDDAREAAGGRRVVAIPAAPPPPGDRFRRSTRECVLGVRAVDAALRDAGWGRDAIRGDQTALVYVTAAAYGAANRAFAEATVTGPALYFPYTAPSAVPAEVAIEFGLTGAYAIFIGGPPATIDALWHAARLVGRGVARRALVLAVETFTECEDLWSRARWLVEGPLTEAAACALLQPGPRMPRFRPVHAPDATAAWCRRRVGETLACGPLIALALARAAGVPAHADGTWRGRRAALEWIPDSEPR